MKVVFEKQQEGGYAVFVPQLPGCISQGETKAEALKNIWEAITLYLEQDVTAGQEKQHARSRNENTNSLWQ